MRCKLSLPHKGRKELDEREIIVGIGPGDPGLDVKAGSVDVDAESTERRDERHYGATKRDQSQITTDSERGVGGHDLVKSKTMNVEGAECEG